jgi:hypothetical protein
MDSIMQTLFENLTEYFNIASQMVEAVDPDASICVVTCGGNSLFTVVPQYAEPKSAEHMQKMITLLPEGSLDKKFSSGTLVSLMDNEE